MTFLHRFATASVTLITVLSHHVSAQGPGYVIAAGIGQGSGWPTCDACAGIDHRQGLTFHARGGLVVSSRVQVSAEFTRWVENASDYDSQFQAGLIVAKIYAAPDHGLALTLGAGVGGSIINAVRPSTGSLTSTGAAYDVGLSYDFPVGAGAAVSPFGDFLASSGAPVHSTFDPTARGSLDGNVLRFGVEVSWVRRR